MIKVEIPDSSPEVLRERIRKGTEIFEVLLAKVETCSDREYEGLIEKIGNTAARVDILNEALSITGVT